MEERKADVKSERLLKHWDSGFILVYRISVHKEIAGSMEAKRGHSQVVVFGQIVALN